MNILRRVGDQQYKLSLANCGMEQLACSVSPSKVQAVNSSVFLRINSQNCPDKELSQWNLARGIN